MAGCKALLSCANTLSSIFTKNQDIQKMKNADGRDKNVGKKEKRKKERNVK